MKTLKAKLHSIEWLANGILGFDFRPLHEEEWPVVTAGAHLDVHLPRGLTRSYSLINAHGENHRYVIAVNRETTGRGGSRYMHEELRVGEVLTLSAPRNGFPLREEASHSVLIAGGIGITPLWSMIQRLSQIKVSWTLHYSARTKEAAAFADQIASLAADTGDHVNFNFDDGEKDRRLDIQAIVDSSPSDADLYCCGPLPMLKAFDAATKEREPSLVHREYFSAPASALDRTCGENHEFTVRLSRTNKTISVSSGITILDALLKAEVDVPHSCMSGICGACETGVLAGVPDHRDFVLSDSERESGATMMICCSRAKSPELTLDL